MLVPLQPARHELDIHVQFDNPELVDEILFSEVALTGGKHTVDIMVDRHDSLILALGKCRDYYKLLVSVETIYILTLGKCLDCIVNSW